MKRQWSGRTYGNGWMHLWLIRLLRVLDVRVIYAFTFVFVLPVVMLVSPSRTHIYRFMRARMGYGRCKSLWKAYVNHCMFAQLVIDRFAMYAGKEFDVKVVGMEHVERLIALPGSFMMMSSHVGNYELAGYTFKSVGKRMNVLLFSGEKASVMENRQRLFEDNNIGMVPVMDDMSHLFEINRILSDGEMLGVLADRINGSTKSQRKRLLGGDVLLPQGPFSIAVMKSVPVIAVDVIKTACRQYTVFITPLEYDTEAPRAKQVESLSQAYIDNMERTVRRYPTQWYNYFEYWV